MDAVSEKLRVGNADCLSALPYRVLANLEFVEYEESSPLSNAAKLHEGRIDLALIPVEELASHGGYVGLDFGVACEGAADGMSVCPGHGSDDMHTVFQCEGVRTMEILDRVISSIHRPMEREGGLKPAARAGLRPFDVWTGVIGRPFVFLVWATRPGTLSLSQLRALNEVFHRCNRASQTIVSQLAGECRPLESERCVKAFGRTHQLYLDRQTIEGLNDFLGRAAQLGLLPATRYRAATFTMLDRKTAAMDGVAPLERILQGAASRKRLSICDALRLADKASLADLALATESVSSTRGQPKPEPLVSAELQVGGIRESVAAAERAISQGVNHLVLRLPQEGLSLSALEKILERLKRLEVGLEALNPGDLHSYARRSRSSVSSIVERLMGAGLDCFGTEELRLLVSDPGEASPSASDLALELIAEAQEAGARFSCNLEISLSHSWEQRLIHLHKLRSLQDRFNGFRYFKLMLGGVPEHPANAVLKLKARMICRLFLDNIASLVCDESNDSLSQIMGLCFASGDDRMIATKIRDGQDARGEIFATDAIISDLQFFKDPGSPGKPTTN